MINYLIKIRANKTIYFILTVIFLYGLTTAFYFKLSHPDDQGRYGLLAQSFLHKKLNLLVNPDPRLIALPNPYDPIQNGSYRLHDVSLFHNRYYLYWGPLPAIIRILFFNQFPEQFFIFSYVTGCIVLYYYIVKKIKNRYFPKINRYLYYFAILSGCLNGAVINLLTSFGIYHEAVAAAQFFFLAGLLTTIHYFSNPKTKYIYLSAIFYTFSFASRITYIIPSFIISIFYLCNLKNAKKLFKITSILSFSPYLIGLLLLGLYNYLRFGNILEFGQRYQLAGIDMSLNYQKLASIHNIPNNIQNYFFNLPTLIYQLPFVSMDSVRYPNIERLVFSVFLISPVTIFILLLSNSSKNIIKIKYFLSLIFILFIFSISYFSPISATRYYFDFIFIFSLLGFISLGLLAKYRITLISIFPLTTVLLFFSLTMYFKALQEYHPQAYFNLNKLVYSITHNINTIDKTAYADLTLVTNKSKYLIINNAVSQNATIHLYPKTIQTYTTVDSVGITLTFVSFESNPVNVTLYYKNDLKQDPYISSQALIIHPGINEIQIPPSKTLVELSNFELL